MTVKHTTNQTPKESRLLYFGGTTETRIRKSEGRTITSDTINYHVDPLLSVIVDTDAYRHATGAALQQINKQQIQPVTFVSRTFSESERNWSLRDLEAFAIVWALDKFRKYSIGRKFVVRTDHCSLQWLTQAKQPKLIRWAIFLSELLPNYLQQRVTNGTRGLPFKEHRP